MYTVARLCTDFLGDARGRVRMKQIAEATYTFYRFQVSKLVKAKGEFPAHELRVHHLEAVDLTNHFVRVLKQLYRWGCEAELVPRDPFKKLKAPATGSVSGP